MPRSDFGGAVRALLAGDADYAVMPVANSLIGRIDESCSAIESVTDEGADLVTVGEIEFPVNHCLMAPYGVTLDTVREVASHPAALAQCARLFEQNGNLRPVAAYDTAGAAADVAARRDITAAAIAPAGAAARYGLSILAENVQDDPCNSTRFAIPTMSRTSATLDVDAPKPPAPMTRDESSERLAALRGGLPWRATMMRASKRQCTSSSPSSSCATALIPTTS